MPKIIPHLWFDREAAEAARFYVDVFPSSRILGESLIEGTPSGDAGVVRMELAGLEFQAISAGPLFKFTPAISFLVACEGAAEVDRLWKRLVEGGSELMALGEYPFSPRYAWIMDRYGLSWQIMDMAGREVRQRITPTLMFTQGVAGRCEEALRFYASLFDGSRVGDIDRYGAGMEPNGADHVRHADFSLSGQGFAAMDSALLHDFTFNEAISLMVSCETQAEIDRYWTALSAVPEAEQCGWLKDRYGLSWQIVPKALGRLMVSSDAGSRRRVTAAFLAMKKFDIAALEKAAKG